MAVIGPSCALACRPHVRWPQSDRVRSDSQALLLGRDPLVGAHHLAHDVGHPEVALDGGGVGRIAPGGVHAGHQLARGEEHGSGLAQRRQHPLDVPQEDRRRADEEHTRLRDALTVPIEEVGRAVEGDGRLPRARTALDDEGAGQVAADDPILLRLDRGDDVAHPARATSVERCHERALALQSGPLLLIEPLEVEHVVLDTCHGPCARGDMTPSDQAAGLSGGGAVEGLGRGRTPIHEQLRAVLSGEADASDVGRLPIGGIDASEAESVLRRLIADQGVFVHRREGIALGTVLVVAAHLRPAHR